MADFWFSCPACGDLGAIDEEQADGKVSIVCPCGFHETGRVTAKLPTTESVRSEDAPTMEGR